MNCSSIRAQGAPCIADHAITVRLGYVMPADFENEKLKMLENFRPLSSRASIRSFTSTSSKSCSKQIGQSFTKTGKVPSLRRLCKQRSGHCFSFSGILQAAGVCVLQREKFVAREKLCISLFIFALYSQPIWPRSHPRPRDKHSIHHAVHNRTIVRTFGTTQFVIFQRHRQKDRKKSRKSAGSTGDDKRD